MPADTTPVAGTSFKDWFNAARYESIAEALAKASARFDRKRFLKLTLEGIESRELMARLQQTSIAAAASLPGSYAQQLKVLQKIAAPDSNGMIGVWYADFVARFGLDDPIRSLPALSYFTRFGSAEFAIREFLLRDPAGTLKVMREWSQNENEHVRRLASEGSRPRLPWGKQLGFLVKDPHPTRPILDTLKADPSLYVRKSVANHLNDISKDHPAYLMELVTTWDQSDERTAWIIRHGLRSLVKQAHPPTLQFLGIGQRPKLTSITFTVSPRRIRLGDRITLNLELTATGKTAQNLLIDYVVHYVKASGGTRAKVFKWKQVKLSPGVPLILTKSQVIRDFTTRRHYPGKHRIEIQINGQRLADDHFVLSNR